MIVLVCMWLNQHQQHHHTLQQPEGDAAAVQADVKLGDRLPDTVEGCCLFLIVLILHG